MKTDALRITGGSLRGRRVPVPPGPVRPTSERARQAWFNIIGQNLDGMRFLDLFAGSGIFSLEALSRGAASATAVDQSRQQAAALEQLATQMGTHVETIASDVLRWAAHAGTVPFDLVYADPPYDYKQYDDLLRALDTSVPLSEGATVSFEHRRKTEPFTIETARLRKTRRAEYGEVWITFFVAHERD